MKTLELSFVTSDEKSLKITVDEPIDGLEATEIKTAMNAIILADVFLNTSGAHLKEIKSARLVDETVTEFEVV